MSRLTDERARLAAALGAAGVRTTYGGRLSAPCVLVEPAEPWISREALARGAIESRWRCTAIAARSDTQAAYDELAAMIDTIDGALLTLRGVSLPTWGAPHDVTLGNTAHPATIATVLMRSEG